MNSAQGGQLTIIKGLHTKGETIYACCKKSVKIAGVNSTGIGLNSYLCITVKSMAAAKIIKQPDQLLLRQRGGGAAADKKGADWPLR